MDNTKLLGKKIKDYRKRNMMTLQQLAEKSGISAGYISKIERGTVNSSLKNIQKLCEVLDTTTDELMKDCFQQKEYEEIQIDNYFIFTKNERMPIYGFVGALDFENIYTGNPYFKVNVMTLSEGMKNHSYYIHSYDEFGIVAKGSLGIEFDNKESYTLEEGECILIKSNTKHAVTNCSNEECISYWIQITNCEK